jgi:hypothetical protein
MTRNSNLPMLLAVAVATVLGLFTGMPLILRKNGIGLLVVLLVPILAIAGMAFAKRLTRTPNTDGAKSKPAYHRKTLIAYGLASILIGPILTLGGGLVVNWINPMHPLDFAPSMLSLSIVGCFAGCTVGIVLAIAAFAQPE